MVSFIKKIQIHPNHDAISHENDIAILMVSKPFDFSLESVRPVSMIENIHQIPKVGDICSIAGWGDIHHIDFYKLVLGFKKPIEPAVIPLQTADVPIWSLKDCQKKREKTPFSYMLILGLKVIRHAHLSKVTNKTICAGNKRETTSKASKYYITQSFILN